MRTSLWISAENTWDDIVTMARHAESTGWDGIWIADHFMQFDDNRLEVPTQECFSLLAGLAAAVPRVRLGSLVAGNTYRHPAVLMKQAATIDAISGGRLVLGLGAGWQENEHRRFGIPLGTTKERLAWFEEACQVVIGLRDDERATFAGERYQLDEAPLVPKPVGPLPLLIGASGEQKMPQVVARYADEWNHWSVPDTWKAKRAIYDAALDAAGRDVGSLYRSTQALVFTGPDGLKTATDFQAIRPSIGGTPEQLIEQVGGWAEAGLDEWIVPTFTFLGMEAALENMDLLISEVAPAFR